MFEEILALMKLSVREGRIGMMDHVYSEMEDDDLYSFDLEQCVYTGTIIERQWDADFLDWKFVIHGKSADDENIAVSAKLDRNQKVVFITTYRL